MFFLRAPLKFHSELSIVFSFCSYGAVLNLVLSIYSNLTCYFVKQSIITRTNKNPLSFLVYVMYFLIFIKDLLDIDKSIWVRITIDQSS